VSSVFFPRTEIGGAHACTGAQPIPRGLVTRNVAFRRRPISSTLPPVFFTACTCERPPFLQRSTPGKTVTTPRKRSRHPAFEAHTQITFSPRDSAYPDVEPRFPPFSAHLVLHGHRPIGRVLRFRKAISRSPSFSHRSVQMIFPTCWGLRIDPSSLAASSSDLSFLEACPSSSHVPRSKPEIYTFLRLCGTNFFFLLLCPFAPNR